MINGRLGTSSQSIGLNTTGSFMLPSIFLFHLDPQRLSGSNFLEAFRSSDAGIEPPGSGPPPVC